MKNAALINDLSGFGRCSLMAQIPVLSVMGHQPVPLPTSLLSAQTGYPVHSYHDLQAAFEPIRQAWQQMNAAFDAISTGFIADPSQFERVNAFLDTFQQPDTILMVDPIMGDNGHAFGMFSPELLAGMQALCRRGTVLVPNLTECCLLTDTDYAALMAHQHQPDFLERVADCGQALRRPGQLVVITGIQLPDDKGGTLIGNLALWEEGRCFRAQPYNGRSYSGTGDLFGAVLLGGLLRGQPVSEVLTLAGSFLSAAIADAAAAGSDRNDGVPFEAHLSKLF